MAAPGKLETPIPGASTASAFNAQISVLNVQIPSAIVEAYIRRSPRPSNRLATEKRKERRDGAQKGRGFVLMDLGVD